MITRTHNAYHLGDNLVHLNFLRKVARAHPERQFVHHAQWNHLKQLSDVILDVPNVELQPLDYHLPNTSINAWRGDKGFWYSHEHRNDFVKFHVEFWFQYLAAQMGVDNPVRTAADMLFDYPAIQKSEVGDQRSEFRDCDVLVINSPPGSGQFAGYNCFALGELACAISAKGHKVVATHELPPHVVNVTCTATAGLSVTAIGHLSLFCHTILMVSTGPSWPTFNIWNQDTVRNRIIMLDSERVEIAPHTAHCSSVVEAGRLLEALDLI